MTEKDILIGVLTKTLNKSEQEVAELLYQKEGDELKLKEGAVDDILSLDSVRVDNIKKNAPIDKDRLNNEYSRGKKEALSELENSLKEKHSVESDLKGIELIDSILASKSNVKLSDDEVKKHPLYIELEKKRIPKEKYDSLQKEFDSFKGNVEKNAKLGKIKEKARTLLAEMKPIVSENPVVAKTREEDFLRKFESYDYQLDGDSIIILRPDGSRLEDGHANVLPFSEFVKNIAAMNYDFAKQGQKSNSGAGDNDDTSTPPKVVVPKNDDEYVKMIREAKTTEQKIAIKEAYHAAKE